MENQTDPMGSEKTIDPRRIPYRTLTGGGKIPGIGLGTFGSDAVDAKTVAEAVQYAVGIGYRHIDCAAVYLNEREIGAALRDVRIRPAVNEMELHPHFQQTELFNYVLSQGLVPIGYSPLGSPGRSERDKTADDTADMEDPVILEIARRRSIHPALVCLKWAVGRGQIPIPFSVKPKNIRSNLEAVIQDPLTDQELKALSGIDKNCRLIKGQVFLWKGARSWEDLWDLDGKIAGWNTEEVRV